MDSGDSVKSDSPLLLTRNSMPAGERKCQQNVINAKTEACREEDGVGT